MTQALGRRLGGAALLSISLQDLPREEQGDLIQNMKMSLATIGLKGAHDRGKENAGKHQQGPSTHC
jgi:pantothenate kinase-related protein Tda10